MARTKPTTTCSVRGHLREKLSTSRASYAMYISLMFRTKRRKIERLEFILAGAQKSGTTALHYFLSRHPDICMGDQQEIHFFDNDAMFVAEPDYAELHKHYPTMASSTIAGDCTPSYLYHEPAMQRIWNYNPKIKLLILLRNPVERAFAQRTMKGYRGLEPID